MENQDQKQLAGAIMVAGIIIAGAILLKDSVPPSNTRNNGNNPNPFETTQLKAVDKNDHILGNKNAEIVIIEYSDTECPYCKIFHTTMHDLIKQRGDEVAWVYRHFPITQLHPKAPKQAEATECAWEQGGNETFWKYVDRLFAITPSNNGLPDEELTNIADYIGLNSASFYTCLESGKYKNKVDQDVTSGIKAGVRGTPNSFILKNGVVVDTLPGTAPLEIILQKIDAIKD